MAGKTYEIGANIELEGAKEYKERIKQVKQEVVLLSSDMKASQAAFYGQGESQEQLADKSEKLRKLFEAQTKQVELMEQQLDAAKNSTEQDEGAINKLAIQLNRA